MYSASLFPDRVRAGGVLLQAFSVGHALLLQRLGSPLDWSRKTAAKPQIGDLILAIGLCARPYPQALRWLESRRMKYWLRWKGLSRSAFFQFDLARFIRYLAEAWNGPRVWVRQEGGGKISFSPEGYCKMTLPLRRYVAGSDALVTALAATVS